MKLIKSIVRPNKVDDVKGALEKLQISGMTVTEVRGHGKQKGHTAIYRGQEYNVSLLPKMEIEVVVADTIVDEAIKAIIEAARTGEIGDGRVFVHPGARELSHSDWRKRGQLTVCDLRDGAVIGGIGWRELESSVSSRRRAARCRPQRRAGAWRAPRHPSRP